MKAALCVLLLVVAACGADEKKEKRGLLGLGYGHGYYGHGLGLYSHSAPLVSHSLPLSHGYGYGGYGLGHGYGYGLGHGYGLGLGHSIAAPVLSHGYAAAPLHYGSPLLGLGHGWH